MSEMRASRKPTSSNTRLPASTSRARVSAPFRERGAASGAAIGRGELTVRMDSLETRALERQTLRVGRDLVERRGDQPGRDVRLVGERPQRGEVEPVELRCILA